jgi:hypothetical protein
MKHAERSARDVSDDDDADVSPSEEVARSSEDEDDAEPTQTQTQNQRQVVADDSDDMDEMDGSLDFTQPDYALQASYSQPTGSQENESTKVKTPSVPAKVGQLSAKAIDDLTSQLVRYMLYKAGLKLPIRFADISKDVYPKHKNVSRCVHVWMMLRVVLALMALSPLTDTSSGGRSSNSRTSLDIKSSLLTTAAPKNSTSF